MKLNDFVLFKNTPNNDFSNYIHFDSDTERDNYYLNENHFEKVTLNNINHTSDKMTIKLPLDYSQIEGLNYGTFYDSRSQKRFYFFIMSLNYINERTTIIQMAIDTITTFCQGNKLATLSNLYVEREHLSLAQYNENLLQLRTNMDIIKTTTKKYVKQETIRFDDFMLIFQSAVDLEIDFGTVDNPNLVTSKGIKYDNLVSPLNLYACELDDYNSIMSELQNYPWIAQNIQKLLIIPKTFIDLSDLSNALLNNKSNDMLKIFSSGKHSQNRQLNFTFSIDDFCDLFSLDKNQDLHLLRTEYTTIEIYSWDSQSILLDPAFLDEVNGLVFQAVVSIGYDNQIAIYPKNYQSTSSETNDGNIGKGTFLNNAIIYKNFTELPVLIDNYKLSLASSANTRQLAEDRQISGRVKNLANPTSSIESKFFDAYSMVSSGLNLASFASKFNDEYEFYRDQKAEFADKSITAPSLTAQNSGYNFQMSNDFFGVTIKMSCIDKNEMEKIKKYYKMFGYEIEKNGTKLSNTHTMSIANYFKFSGSWVFDNVRTDLMLQMKALFEKGVRFWHNDGSDNPMAQNILENEMIS